jgi:vacuolar-type H+-ATPase subunit I/STV1
MYRDDFFLKVAKALSGCQLVEQQLKLYISEALELAAKCIGNRMVFTMSGEDYEGSSLERLIEVFKKLTDNATLVTELRKFKDERNFLSHRGITHCLDYEDDLFESAVAEYEQRLAAIEREAKRLQNELHQEANKFRPDLYFGEFPDAP